MSVDAIRSLGSIDPRKIYQSIDESVQRSSFADTLRNAVDEVNELSAHRQRMVEGMISGEVTEVHDVMMASEEASLAFELMLEIRNKLLDAYKEVMRMSV
ncbi:MAG: flagellar hook-basal body complex protein FliE [bacterium]